MIILVTLAGFAISAGVSLVVPPRFMATTVFVPFGVEKEITGFSGFFAPLGAFGEAFATYLRARNNYLIDFFLRSRRVSDILAARFDLKSVYGVPDGEEVRKKLQEHTSVVIRDEGAIILSVEDRSRARALAITEEYLAMLDSLLINLTVQNSHERAAFLTGEIARRKKAMAVTDSLLTTHLEQHGLFDMEEQLRTMLEIVSDLSARLSILDVEKKLLEMTLRPGSKELERVELEWNKLREQLIMLRDAGAEPSLFPPLKKLPEISTRYVSLLGERRMQEFVIGYLRLRLVDAEVSANGRVSVLRLLDPPSAPERRVWPKRKQIVMVSTAAAFFWACFLVIVWERRKEGALGSAAAAAPGCSSESGPAERLEGG